MAIAQYKPKGLAQLVKPQLPAIQPKEYSSPLIDTKYVPSQAILAYVTGSRWFVNYYQQLITNNSDLKAFDPAEPNVYQQYNKIEQLEIRVESSLSSNQNPATATMVVTGTGIIYPNFVPNVGDTFTADIGDGNEGIFSIINVNRKTYMHDSVYEVEYQLVAIVSQDPTLLTNLDNKVQNTYVFDRDLLESGSNPVVLSQDYENLIRFRQSVVGLTEFFFDTFYSREYHTLTVPGQEGIATYDSMLLDTLLKTVQTFDSSNIRKIRSYDVSGDPYLSQPQFWKLMVERDISKLALCNQKMALAPIDQFGHNPYLRTICYSFMDYIVYPNQPDFSVGNGLNFTAKAFDGAILNATTVGYSSQIAASINNTYQTVNKVIPIIYPVLQDAYYVLSENFYNPALPSRVMSLLEVLVTDYLNNKPLDATKMNIILDACYGWPRLEQFYYIPIILILLKVYVNNYQGT